MELVEKENIVAKLSGIDAPKVTCARVPVYVFMDKPGSWTAIMPSLDGARVDGHKSNASARDALSGLVGRLMLDAWNKGGPAVWNDDHGFVPPPGAMERRFAVSV